MLNPIFVHIVSHSIIITVGRSRYWLINFLNYELLSVVHVVAIRYNLYGLEIFCVAN